LAKQQAIDFEEIDLQHDDLLTIDGAFLCSTLMEIRPISFLDSRTLQTIELPLYKRLIDAFRRVTHQ
jgi:branched-chain amino acid aminotransferase